MHPRKLVVIAAFTMLLAFPLMAPGCAAGPGKSGTTGGSSNAPAPTQPFAAATQVGPAATGTSAAGQQAGACSRDPDSAVRGYLNHLDRGEFELALAALEHPMAPVWPGVGIVQSLLGSKVSADLVHVRDGRVFPPLDVGPEALCLSEADVSPGQEAAALGLEAGRSGRWRFAFWLERQGECWRLLRGGPIDDAARAVLGSGVSPFRNVRTTLPDRARPGQTYSVTFDLDLPAANVSQPLGDVIEGITLLLHPRPDVGSYPKGYEEEYSVPNISGRWPKRVELGEGLTTENIYIGAPEIPTDLEAGRYRLYLGYRAGSTTLYWPISDLSILASGGSDRPPTKATATTVPSSGAGTTVAEIQADPARFKGQRVLVQGRGITVATLPLCPGYVGFDKRVRFSGTDASSTYAVDRLPQGVARMSPAPRLFEGRVGWYEGEVGCPGQVRWESFPYLEVERVVENGR